MDKLLLNTTDGSRKDELYSAKESLPRLFFIFAHLKMPPMDQNIPKHFLLPSGDLKIMCSVGPICILYFPSAGVVGTTL